MWTLQANYSYILIQSYKNCVDLSKKSVITFLIYSYQNHMNKVSGIIFYYKIIMVNYQFKYVNTT